MALKGFLNNEDEKNIKLDAGNAKLLHESDNACSESNITMQRVKDNFYFDLCGNNSQLYELDRSSIPKLVSKITPRPVSIELRVPPKEYDGDCLIDLETVSYKFKKTSSDESGLIEGNQAGNKHGIVIEDLRVHSQDSNSEVDVLFRSLSVMGKRFNFEKLKTEAGKQLIIYDTSNCPIFREKWLPLSYNSVDNKFKLKFNSYSWCQSRLSFPNCSTILGETNELCNVNHSDDGSRTGYISTELSSLRVDPHSNVTIVDERGGVDWVYVHTDNLFDQPHVYVDNNNSTQAFRVNHSFISAKDLPAVGKYYSIIWKGEKLTVRRFLEMTHLSEQQLEDGVFSRTISSKNDADLKIAILKSEALYVFQTAFTGISLVRIPKEFIDGEFVVYKTSNTSASIEYMQIGLFNEVPTYHISHYSMVKYPVVNGCCEFNVGVNDRICVSTNSSYAKICYTPSYDFEEATGELHGIVKTIATGNDHTYRSDIAKSDFGKLRFEVDELNLPQDANTSHNTELNVVNPRLADTDNVTASNYKIESIHAVSRLLPRRLSLTWEAISRAWDGSNNFNNISYTLHNKIEDDDVDLNPEYFRFISNSSDSGDVTVICIPDNTVSPLVGNKSSYYVLDKYNLTSHCSITRKPVTAIGREIIFNINDSYFTQSNNASLDGLYVPNHIDLTYSIVDYNNNDEIIENALINTYSMSCVITTEQGQLSLLDAKYELNISENISKLEGDIVRIHLSEDLVVTEGCTLEIKFPEELLGSDASNLKLENTSMTVTARIRHNN